MSEDARPSPAEPGRTAARRVTIDDVAEAAGVSRQTVSNVLSGRGRLGEDTRVRVQAAIESMGFRPHQGASSMRTRRTRQLAHPMPAIELDPGNAIAVEFIQALVVAAGARDHHVVLAASQDATGEIDELIRSGRVDAFIFANLEPRDPRIGLVTERGFPFACFGRTDPDLPQCWVDIDNAEGVGRAVDHLLDCGHEDIAFLGYDGNAYWDYERIAGYTAAITASRRVPKTVLTRNDNDSIIAACDRLLDAFPHVTAVVTGSDSLAAAMYSAADRRGLVIGADLAVTGFDASVIGRSLSPRLTTLAIPLTAIAEAVVQRALREIEGPTGEPGRFLPLELLHGDSA